MKTRSRKKTSVTIPTSRWLAYACAGAATALVGATSADGEIHYSGRIDFKFSPDGTQRETFPLEQPGNYLYFYHQTAGRDGAGFSAVGLQSGAFAGYSVPEYGIAYKLRAAQNHYVSEKAFSTFYLGFLYQESIGGFWKQEDTAFVGFRFNNGAGQQYGWARIHMGGVRFKYGFFLLDYAWADPGEPIRPGQTSSSSKDDVTGKGSLGLLAAGAAGLDVWRQERGR